MSTDYHMPQTFPSLFWRTPWLQPLNDTTAWNTVLQGFNATWSIDQVRARVARLEQRREQRDGLHRLPEPHLVA